MKTWQIDRFEENFAVMISDEKEILDIPKDFFGTEVHVGDIFELQFEEGKPCSARFLAEETEACKARIKSLMEKLKNKKKK